MKKLILVLAFSVHLSYAQDKTSAATDSARNAKCDSLFQVADAKLGRGDVGGADGLYKTLIELRDQRGHVGSGKTMLLRGDWNRAHEQFEKALAISPNDIEAQYFSAIAYREIAKWRSGDIPRGVSVERAYARSDELFQSVILRDSSYRDVLYQFALLRKDEGRYEEAMRTLCALLQHPQLQPLAYQSFIRLCRTAISEGHGADVLNGIQKPFEDLALYVRAEMIGSETDFKEAENLFLELQRCSPRIPVQLPLLRLARIYAQTGEYVKLENVYWQSIRYINNESAAAIILEDLKVIMSQEEIREYMGLSIESIRDEFLPAMWNSRNPHPGSLTNPRLREHYQRIVYAEENYFLDRERYSLYYNFRSPMIDFEFKDIGLIYLRHGAPSEILKKSEAEAGREVFLRGRRDAVTTETWIYEATGERPQLVFHFAGAQKSFSVGGLQTRTQVAEQPMQPENERHSDIVQKAPLSKIPEIVPDMAFWDPNYFHFWTGTEAEKRRAGERITDQASRSVIIGMTTERFIPSKTENVFEIPVAVSCFRGKAGNASLEVSYLIPSANFLKQQVDSVHTLRVATGLAIYDAKWRKVFSVADTLRYLRMDGKFQDYLGLQRISLKPDSYYVAIFAQRTGSENSGKSLRTVYASNYKGVALSISDVQLASEIRSDTFKDHFYKDGLRVVVNPLGKHPLKNPLFVYFETYHASRDQHGKSILELNLSIRSETTTNNLISGLLNLFGKKKGYFVASEVENPRVDGTIVKYLVIDVSQMSAGKYVVDIEIRDKLANEKAVRAIPIELLASDEKSR